MEDDMQYFVGWDGYRASEDIHYAIANTYNRREFTKLNHFSNEELDAEVERLFNLYKEKYKKPMPSLTVKEIDHVLKVKFLAAEILDVNLLGFLNHKDEYGDSASDGICKTYIIDNPNILDILVTPEEKNYEEYSHNTYNRRERKHFIIYLYSHCDDYFFPSVRANSVRLKSFMDTLSQGIKVTEDADLKDPQFRYYLCTLYWGGFLSHVELMSDDIKNFPIPENRVIDMQAPPRTYSGDIFGDYSDFEELDKKYNKLLNLYNKNIEKISQINKIENVDKFLKTNYFAKEVTSQDEYYHAITYLQQFPHESGVSSDLEYIRIYIIDHPEVVENLYGEEKKVLESFHFKSQGEPSEESRRNLEKALHEYSLRPIIILLGSDDGINLSFVKMPYNYALCYLIETFTFNTNTHKSQFNLKYRGFQGYLSKLEKMGFLKE
jgi:hypothetical protein